MRLDRNLPLSDVTVVSVEQAIAAPLATRHLADWGARVIKIERRGNGDFCRDYDDVLGGNSSQFVWTNRSKQSLALDIKDPKDRSVVEALLEKADVFVQNLAPGAAIRLGLDAAALTARFPRLIACDISGYGSSGPYSRKKAYDLLVQCEAGLLAVNGSEEHPAKVGISVVDIATGMYALNGILMGLYWRERTGKGMAFEVSLFDAVSEWMSYPALYTQGSGHAPRRTGTRHSSIAPYGPFKTSDGTVFFGIQNEREWLAFCTKVLVEPTLASNPLFMTNTLRFENGEALTALIENRFSESTSSELIARLDDASIANARLNSVEEFLRHPQLIERRRVCTVETEHGPVMSFLPPVTIPDCEPIMGKVPYVGEHNAQILAELKMDRGETG